MRTILQTICMVLLFGIAAIADDAAIGAVGGTLMPLEDHAAIRMVREDIHIKTFKNGINSYRIEAYCRFVFHNEGNATKVMMGFPEDIDGNSNGFSYFQSKVDGKPVYVRRSSPDKPEMPISRIWRIKEVYFDKNQTRVIEDIYGGPAGTNTSGESTVRYVLKTGSSWHGLIGKIAVTIDASAFEGFQTMIPSPPNFQKHGNKLIWHFENVEPKEDIKVIFWPGYSKFIVNGKDVYIRYACESGMPYLENGYLVAQPALIGNLLNKITQYMDDTSYDSENVVIKIGDKIVRLSVGDTNAIIDGRRITLPKAPRIRRIDGEAALVAPIAAIMRALGATVRYDNPTGRIYINI